MALYYDVQRSGVPNYRGVRRQVPSQLHCNVWDDLLTNYHDKQITEFLRYGWPVTYSAPDPPVPTMTNHGSALRHPRAIDSFIAKEFSKNALLGPFSDPPFSSWTQVSPLMTRDKPDGSGKRVIIDLSFPKGSSVNDGIIKGTNEGELATYTLPSALDLAELMLRAGRGCYIWKADLERAYRQLRVDPLDYPLLAIKHKGVLYIDICPSFGCKTSGSCQQRVSNAVTYLMAKQDFPILAYVDDFCSVEPMFDAALQSFTSFEALTSNLSLKLSPEKTCFPSTCIEWLGYHFDSNLMTITIPQEKLRQVQQEAATWTTKTTATKAQLQSLAGKLNFIGNCVQPARRFMNRVLTTLSEAHSKDTVDVSPELKKDVIWFRDFAAHFNGKLLIEPKLPLLTLECDACPKGGGGFSPTEYYSFCFPQSYTTDYHISQLEAVNAVMAVKTLTPTSYFSGRVLIKTDNSATMFALSTGKTKDPVLAACARELWLFSAIRQLDILIHHTPGQDLVLADALSRESFDPTLRDKAKTLVAALKLSRAKPVELDCVLTSTL